MKERKGEHPLGDEGQLIALAIFLVVWIGDSFFLHLTTGLSNWIPLYIRLAVAGVLMLVAYGLFRTSHFIVSQEERPDYVVTNGAYRYVRHPLYLASLTVFLALMISTLSLASFGIGIAIYGFYNYIAVYEEQLLERKFGEPYLAYKQETGRWLPHMSHGH